MAVFETLGIQDVVAKSVGSSNPHNMVKATMQALKNIQSPRSIASKEARKLLKFLVIKTIKINYKKNKDLKCQRIQN